MTARTIGDRPLSLIPHLRATINLLLDERSDYRWTDCCRCNAGLLARAIHGYTYEAMRAVIGHYGEAGHWHRGVWEATVCQHTAGEPWPKVMQRLFDAGLVPADLGHVENLSHRAFWEPHWRDAGCSGSPMILVGLEHRNQRNKPASVALYLSRWIAAIETHHAATAQPAAETAPAAITIPSTSHQLVEVSS